MKDTNLIKKANKLKREGKLDEAIHLYQQAIESNPNFAWHYHNLGEALAKKGCWGEAIATYQKAIQLNPNLASFFISLGGALVKQQLLDQAVSCFQKAIEINSSYYKAYNHLGYVWFKKQNWQLAIECFQKSIGLQPNSYWAYYKLAETLSKQENFQEADKYYSKAHKLNSTFNVSNLTSLANYYKSDKGDLILNSHHYTRSYEEEFSIFRNKKIIVLEIGILHPHYQNKGLKEKIKAPSLKMWSKYFPEALIIGFDKEDFSFAQEERIRIYQGDQGDRGDLEKLAQEFPNGFDIIIDDGSHASHHQQTSLAVLFKYLKAGGAYVIEDLHYQPSNIELPSHIKTRDFLKYLTHNEQASSVSISVEELLFLKKSIQSIKFYDSLSSIDNYPTEAIAFIWKSSEINPALSDNASVELTNHRTKVKVLNVIKFVEYDETLLWGYNIEHPVESDIADKYEIPLSGWVLGKASPVAAVEVISNGVLIKRAALGQPRTDVAQVYPNDPSALNSGFMTEVNVDEMPVEAELSIEAVFSDSNRLPLGIVKYLKKQPL